MKVFDFTNGVRGKLLGHLIVGAIGGNNKISSFNDYKFHSGFGYDFNSSDYCNQENILQKYGVEAVCWCFGLFEDGWEWCFTATDKWIKENKSCGGDLK